MIKIIKCFSLISIIAPLFGAINVDNGYRSIVFTVVPNVTIDNRITYKMACLFNEEDTNYHPNSISLYYSDKFSFSTQIAEIINQPLVLGETYKLRVNNDGSFIDLESYHYVDNAFYEVCVNEKLEEEKGDYQGIVPVRLNGGVYYDSDDNIVDNQDVSLFFKHQLLQKYYHKLLPVSYIENYPNQKVYNLEAENEINDNFFYIYSAFRGIKYIINNINGSSVNLENLSDGDKLYLFAFEDYFYAYTYNPFSVSFDSSILEVEDYNIATITIKHDKGGVINE